ncbi:MAG: glycosyltransferase 87 family protein [Thermomicrobiales bacterium]
MAETEQSSGDTPLIADVPAPNRGVIRIWIFGLAIALICTAFAWRYPLVGNTNRLADIGILAKYGKPEFVGFCAGIGGMFFFYLLGIRESRKLTPTQAALPVFTCGLAQATAMVWMYPVSAIDIFIYAVRSRLFTEYGLNPLAAYPRDFSGDPYMRFASADWANSVSPYGPLWNLIAAPATYLGGNNIGIAVALFKVLAIISALAGAAMIYLALRHVRPNSAATGALVFLWNPLLLWEGVGNGHNDLVLMVFVLAAFYAWYARWDGIVIPLLVAGATLKYMPLLLIPFAGLAVFSRASTWRARARVVLLSAVGSAVAIAVGFFPFYDFDASKRSFDSQNAYYITSLPSIAINEWQDRYNIFDIIHVTDLIGRCAVGIGLVVGAILILHNPERWPRLAFELTFVYLLVATPSMRNWYAIWLLGIVAVLPFGWPTARAIAWSLGSLAVYGFFIWVWAWWQVDFATINAIGVAIMVAPALVLTVGEIAAALIHKQPNPSAPALSKAEAPA